MKKLSILSIILVASCGIFNKDYKNVKYEVRTENAVYFTDSIAETENCVKFNPTLGYRNGGKKQIISVCGNYTMIKLNKEK